jgi:ubiquinone/menaquinone biosynthesis C-methylase UbiE
MYDRNYIMESEEESIRLDLKTDPKIIEEMARWAGIRPGMRIADLGCGPGKTTFYLNNLVQPGGSAVGVDISQKRIDYAQAHYSEGGTEFITGDIRKPLEKLELFDFIWIRFVLEHHLANSFDIVKTASSILKPGGIICLVDLDYNCLTHYGLSPRLEKTLYGIMSFLEKHANFDPYVGRKLYSFLYDLEFEEIDIRIDAHHCIFGELKETDAFNWMKKVEIAAKNSGYRFEEYEDKFEGFLAEFRESFFDPRRFTYTPIIVCRGRKS